MHAEKRHLVRGWSVKNDLPFFLNTATVYSIGLMMDSFGRDRDMRRILTFLALQQSPRPKLFRRRRETAVMMRQERAAIFLYHFLE